MARPGCGHGFIVVVTLGMLLALAGCHRGVQAYIDKANADRLANKLPAAVIELKNALQRDPRSLKARLLFAQTCLDMSDGATAEAQALLAQQNGADDRETARLLAEARLLQGKFDKVIEQTAHLPQAAEPELQASLLAARGTAFAKLGQMDAARAALDEAVKAAPHSVDVLVALAETALIGGDLTAARQHLTEAQQLDPKSFRLVALDGDIAFAARDYAAAEKAYQSWLDAEKWNDVARSDVALAQIAGDHFAPAIENLDKVLLDVPKDPNVNYLRALAAFRAHQFTAAQAYGLAVLGILQSSPPAELIVGAASYAMRQYAMADKYLTPYVAKFPQNMAARKLLASVELARGHPDRAMTTLTPVLDKSTDDAQMLALIGMAAARTGNLTTASDYLKQAAAKAPENAAIRSELGATQVALGKVDAGIEDFQKAIKAHPAELSPRLQLFLTYMRTKEYEQAIRTAEEVQQALPNEPEGYDMLGVAYLAQGDVKNGRDALLKARGIAPGDLNANQNLAKLAIADNKPDEARQYYQSILKADPKTTTIYIALAELEDGLGHVKAAETALQTAVQMNPDDLLAKAALAKFELYKGNFQAALNAALPALQKLPRNPALLEAAGRARLALGRTGDAIANFKTLVEVVPNAAWPRVLLASAFAADGITESAVTQANDALKIEPENVAAKLVLIHAYLATNKLDQARALVAEIKQSAPDDFAVNDADGTVAQAQGRIADAIAAFSNAIRISDNVTDRRRLAALQATAGHPKDAEKTMEAWVVAHPNDLASRKMLGDLYLANHRLTEAETQYAALVKAEPKDADVINNLAWTLSLMDRPKEALAYARQAVTLAPDSANALDTLGMTLLQNGIPAEAATELNKAWQKSPNRADIQLHLAQALAKSGKNSDALDVLRGLLLRSQAFKERDEAQKLLQQLGG